VIHSEVEVKLSITST